MVILLFVYAVNFNIFNELNIFSNLSNQYLTYCLK